MQGDSSLCLSISLTLIHNHLFDQLVAPIFNVVSDELPDLKFVKVDTDIHEETVDMFNIQGLPMFILFDQGKPIATHSGALNKTKLREFIESNLVTRKNINAQPIIKHISRSISTQLKMHQNQALECAVFIHSSNHDIYNNVRTYHPCLVYFVVHVNQHSCKSNLDYTYNYQYL